MKKPNEDKAMEPPRPAKDAVNRDAEPPPPPPTPDDGQPPESK